MTVAGRENQTKIGSMMVFCSNCGKELSEEDIYTVGGSKLCEDCAMDMGLFPLEHTGSRRDKISERGRRLTLPKK